MPGLFGANDTNPSPEDTATLSDMRAFHLMLVCDPADNDAYFKTAPCMLAEVLSPGTEALALLLADAIRERDYRRRFLQKGL